MATKVKSHHIPWLPHMYYYKEIRSDDVSVTTKIQQHT